LVLMGRNQSQGCWALPPWINIENHGRTEYQWFTMRSYEIMDSYGMIQSMNRINCGPTVFQNHTNTHTNIQTLQFLNCIDEAATQSCWRSCPGSCRWRLGENINSIHTINQYINQYI
jgi:hypothetical protein